MIHYLADCDMRQPRVNQQSLEFAPHTNAQYREENR